MNREYEIGLVINPTLDDEKIQAQIARITQTIESFNGEVLNIARWGRRRLAYPIEHHIEGYYTFIEFTLSSDNVREVENMVHVQENVMRHLTTYIDPRVKAERLRRIEKQAATAAAHAAAQAAAAQAAANAATAVAVEEPAIAIEEPAVAIEEPAVAIEEPAVAVEEPAVAVPEPAVAVAEVISPVIEESAPIVEEPVQTIVDEPAPTAE